MGLHLNWIAVQDGDKATLLERAGLVECGVTGDEVNCDYACAVLPGGWFLLVSGRMRLKLAELLPKMSPGGFALGGEVEEHVMWSRLSGFRNGLEAWSIDHDPEVDPRGLAVLGDPPDPFREVLAELTREQEAAGDEEVDYIFDVPVRLGARLCGYDSNEMPPIVWTVLEPDAPGLAPRPAPQLAARMRAELVPWLATHGWEKAESAEGLEFDFERLRGRDRQIVRMTWRDGRKDLWITAGFVVRDVAAEDDRGAKVIGEIQVPPTPFWRRWRDRLLALGAKPASYEARLEAELARVREDLQLFERFLTDGEHDPRLTLHRPRPAAAS